MDIYQIDAFTNKVFGGNPAAVCPLNEWIPEQQMQQIAAENNLSETAFYVPQGDDFEIRWFTPTSEVDLCGHATLAAAYVIFNYTDYRKDTVQFLSKSGPLSTGRDGSLLILDFPSQKPQPCEIPESIQLAFNKPPMACLKHQDYILVYESEKDIISASPDLNKLINLDLRGVCITASGNTTDFVSRFFAPKYGIPEDSVTGSSFTQLAPYWSEKLGLSKMTASQLSRRQGFIQCEIKGDRVLIAGEAALYMKGRIITD